MTETTNLKLQLPSGSSAPDIQVINDNMVLLDGKVYEALNQVEKGTAIEE